MQRRLSTSALVVIATVILLAGMIGGGIIGGTAGYILSQDDDPEVVTATSPSNAEATNISDLNPASESTAEQAQGTTATPTESDNSASSDTANVPDVVNLTSEIAKQVSPAVVTVINEQKFVGGIFGSQQDQEQPVGSGTGFIISDDGYVVTNNHVVEGSDSLRVIFTDGTEQEAKLIGTDPLTDLAVLQITGDVPATVTFGDSDTLEPGDWVIAIGSALGEFTNTVTQGVVSGLHRELGGNTINDMIQHDAAINPGNSGGPLLNMQGEVIGVNTAVVRNAGQGVTAEGLGFAIPSNTVKEIVNTLIDKGEVVRPLIGISYQTLTPQGARAAGISGVDHGAYVAEVTPDGPAAQAGIQAEDVITAIDGQEISAENSLMEVLFNYQPGDTIQVEIYRSSTDETLTVDVTLGERPADLQ